jgi:hypothetical protein
VAQVTSWVSASVLRRHGMAFKMMGH